MDYILCLVEIQLSPPMSHIRFVFAKLNSFSWDPFPYLKELSLEDSSKNHCLNLRKNVLTILDRNTKCFIWFVKVE